MADNGNERRFTVVPDREAVTQVSDFLDCCVEDYAVPIRVGYSLKVVADEIFSNIVSYSGAKTAQVLFQDDPDRVTLVFQDDGTPYNPMEAEEPDTTTGVEERGIGGLGLFMVKKMAEEISYEYTSGQNQLTVVLTKATKKMSLEDFDL